MESRLEDIRTSTECLQAQPKQAHMANADQKDDTCYFSKHMLLGKFSQETWSNEVWNSQVLPALQGYIRAHVAMTQSSSTDSKEDATLCLQRHAAYDTAMSQHGPTLGLLSSVFGKPKANAILKTVLFPLCED